MRYEEEVWVHPEIRRILKGSAGYRPPEEIEQWDVERMSLNIDLPEVMRRAARVRDSRSELAVDDRIEKAR